MSGASRVQRQVHRFETREEADARHDAEVRAAQGVDGLTFPLRVVALGPGAPRLASGKIVRVRAGAVFEIGCAADFSRRWMRPLDAAAPDMMQNRVDGAQKREPRPVI